MIMKLIRLLFAGCMIFPLTIYTNTCAQFSLKIKLSSPEHGEQIFTYDIPNVYSVNDSVSFTMRFVKGGTFIMGCTAEQDDCNSNELPNHKVTLNDFSIGETEVTQGLWEAVMGSNPSVSKYSIDPARNHYALPVETVSWEDIVGTNVSAEAYKINGVIYYQNGFCYKLSQFVGGNKKFRLPTEAEWEYVARGGSVAEIQTKYSGSDSIGDIAWYSDNSGNRIHEVGRKQANALGIYDMSGNIREWCSDWFEVYSGEDQTNPTGEIGAANRVNRGGCMRDAASVCRIYGRNIWNPDKSANYIGFRLAL